MAYDGFISYSHAADGQLAPALQRGLQRLAKPWNRRRALDIFRDETGLSVNPHLWSSVQTALDESEWFILLASPEAAASAWVNKEIEHWLATKSADHILPVVTDGTWAWNTTSRAFTTDSDAVPSALRQAFGDEPRHLDLRWARTESDLDLHNTRFRDAIADLAAPLHGLPKDEVEGEDIRQYRRTRRLARGAMGSLALLLVAALVGGSLAVLNGREADLAKGRAEREATVANVRRLAAQAVARARSAPDLALLLGLEAQRLRDSSESRGALLTVLQRTAKLQRLVTGFPRDEIVSGLSEDGRTLALSDSEGRVRLVDFETRAEKQSFATEQLGPVAVFFAPGTDTLATTSLDRTTRLWNGRTGQPRSPLLGGHRYFIVAADFSSDGRSFVTEDASGVGIVWEVLTGRLMANVPKVLQSLGPEVALSPDGHRLAVAGVSTTVFDVPSMTKAFELPFDPDSPGALAFNPDGTLLAVANRRVVQLWDLRSGRFRDGTLQPEAGTGTFVTRLAFSPDGSKLGAGMSNGTVTVWDVSSGLVATEPLVGHRSPVSDLRFLNGSELVTTSSTDAAMWSLQDRDPLAPRVSLDDLADSLLSDAEFSRDGQLVAFSDVLGQVAFVDGRTLEPVGTPLQVGTVNLEGFPDGAVALSADGRVLAMGVANGEARHVDVVARAMRPARVQAAPPGIFDLEFSPDDRIVAAGSADGSVTLIDAMHWTVRRRRVVHPAPGPVVVDFSPDGRLLATGGSDGRVVLDHTANGRRRTVARRGSQVTAVHFSADGRFLAAGFTNGTVLIIDLARGRPVGASLVGHSDVTAVQFSPDGRFLAVGGAGGTVALWDIATRERLGEELFAHSSIVMTMAFSPEGKTLTSIGFDHAVVRWNLDPAAWTKRACELAARNLTRAEWREHIGNEPYRRTCAQWPAA